ncbi:MAG: N-acylglucosamine 2-epimerase [bacterium]|nr:N-acylglucosamine 2-epimerase [bacterium]
MPGSYRQKYRSELVESVMPFWLQHGVDPDFGGYFSCLDRKGKVYDTRKYVWLQGRGVWTFSRLYNELEPRPEWLEAARSGVDFIRRYARDPQGRCYFSLTREGVPVFFQRKPYAAVFVMLGLLEYARAAGDSRAQEEAVDLFWRVRAWVEYPGTLGRPQLEGQQPTSKLADIMVLAMMALELHRAVGDRRYHQVLEDCLESAFRHADPERRILVEEVAPNGAKRYQSPEGRIFNPGHAIEMAWLLLHMLRIIPDAGRQTRVLDLLEGSLEFGWDTEHGGLFYFLDVLGKPALPLEAPMKLWWPHTEALYAVILAHNLTGDKKWLDWRQRIDDYAFSHFADPEHGEWFGYCDRQGNLTSTCKGNNYKGMFHLARSLLMCYQALASAGQEDAHA